MGGGQQGEVSVVGKAQCLGHRELGNKPYGNEEFKDRIPVLGGSEPSKEGRNSLEPDRYLQFSNWKPA